MARPFLNFFTVFINGVMPRPFLKKTPCELRTDHVEDEKEQQKWMDRGASKYLPEELVIESILTKSPVRTLAACCFVCKLWYDTILLDSRFAAIHYIQNKNKVSLVFSQFNVSRGGTTFYLFNILIPDRKVDIDIKCVLTSQFKCELVGFCNGLACALRINGPDYTSGTMTVVNPSRNGADALLDLSYVRPTGGYIYLCHGFGFDSLSQVYKVVMVFVSKDNDEFLCMVITLGTRSWRKVFTSQMVTIVPTTLYRQATCCGGDLFWRTKNKIPFSYDIGMLLSFDLHKEKINFIGLPTECTPKIQVYENERQYLAVDHLLEFKGYPCIARSERPRTRSNNDHCGHGCNYQAGVCCCCYKVHMYILKDKNKQEWSREETFDVQIQDPEGLLPTPLCCGFRKKKSPLNWYFDTSAATPPTRILILLDQVLLYWFNGERLVLYNMQEKRLKVVECSRSFPDIFQSKMNEDLERPVGYDDDYIYCPSMDYQLHAQVENIISLDSFKPDEAKTSEYDSFDDILLLPSITLSDRMAD